MLSRRRSSERTPDAQPSVDGERSSTASVSPPPQTRITSCLRAATPLFWVAAEPEVIQSSVTPAVQQEAEFPKRRLFRSGRRSVAETRGHFLVVCMGKAGGIRVQHVLDLGSRALAQRAWALGDLRKIDGMGEGDVGDVRFGLYFAGASRVIAWKCRGVKERAVFLWALLQCCVANLRRAPPVVNLLLLDLQRVAEGGVAGDGDASDVIGQRGAGEGSLGGGIRGRMMREMARGQRVMRTLSEPKASKVVEGIEEKRADTIAPLGTDAVSRGLNMDERAFMAAAKRMGGAPVEGAESCGSDPKARLFQNRFKMGEANTAKVVAERKWQQEKKLFKLSSIEQDDLASAMSMFREEGGGKLAEFGTWTEAKIQSLEVANISDIVTVEKKVMPQNEAGGNWPYKGLVESMTVAEPWLFKCQTMLAPYAELARELHRGVELLEVQMSNMEQLDTVLADLLDTLTFEQSEQSLVDGIGNADISSKLEEFESEDFQKAVKIISSKVESLERLSALYEMAAVQNARILLSQRQVQASLVLLPALRAYVDHLYLPSTTDICDEYFKRLRTNRLLGRDSEERRKFLVAVKSIAIFGKDAFAELVEHYILLSSNWILDMLRAMMKRVRIAGDDISAYVARTEVLVECLFFVCIAEGAQAFQLFFNATDSAANGADLCFSRILRRQVLDRAIVSEFLAVDVGDTTIAPCLHLHAFYFLDDFSARLANCNEQEIDALLSRTEKRFSGNNGNIDETFPQANGHYTSDFLFIPAVENGTLNTVLESSLSLYSNGSESSQRSLTSRLCQSLEDKGCVRETLSAFFDVCRDISLSCHSRTEKLVGAVIAAFSTPRDVNSEIGRAGFFKCVERAISLCHDLSSPRLQVFRNEDNTHETMVRTKTLCERLVAATMRSTEIISHSCSEAASDVVKLQSYGYLSVKLGKLDKPGMFVPLAHLSTRVRKFVLVRWAEREIYSSLLGKLKFDTTRRTADAQKNFLNSVEELNVSETASLIDKKISAALERAAYAGVILPIYADIVVLTKEKMEETLRSAKKDRAPSSARSAFLIFSRDLMGMLRQKLRHLQEQETNSK